MPLQCPKCSRTNPDTTPNCMYCKNSLEGAREIEVSEDAKRLAEHFIGKIDSGKKQSAPPEQKNKAKPPPLPATTPKADGPPEKKPAPIAGKPPGRPQLEVILGGKAPTRPKPAVERFWVVMAPMGTLDNDISSNLAKKLSFDHFVIKQRMATGNPWVIRRFKEADEARVLASELRQMGLDVYSITDSEISSIPRLMIVRRVAITEKGLKFTRERESLTFGWTEVVLIVKGKMRMELTGESIAKRTHPSLKNKGIQSMASDSWEYEMVDIYSKSGKGVRLSERDTDYAGLGKFRTPSSLRNLRWIITQFEKISGAVINDGYRRMGKILKPAGVKGDKVAHRLGRSINEQQDRRYMDNIEHFDEYSTLAYLYFSKMEG